VPVPGRPDPAAGPAPLTAAVALEDRGEAPGRVRMQRLPAEGGLVAFVGRVVEPGTLVRATRLEAWWPLAELGFPTERAPRLTYLPAVERALAGWLRATHQGATSPAQLDCYLDEFTFRFNRRASTHRGLLFYRLLEEAVVTPPMPDHRVVGAAEEPGGESGRQPAREPAETRHPDAATGLLPGR
jgi:hypothetical protein